MSNVSPSQLVSWNGGTWHCAKLPAEHLAPSKFLNLKTICNTLLLHRAGFWMLSDVECMGKSLPRDAETAEALGASRQTCQSCTPQDSVFQGPHHRCLNELESQENRSGTRTAAIGLYNLSMYMHDCNIELRGMESKQLPEWTLLDALGQKAMSCGKETLGHPWLAKQFKSMCNLSHMSTA